MIEAFRNIEVFLESGFMYSILALGFYISYTILDFPDLSVEGTFLTGAVVFSLAMKFGVNPWIAMIVCAICGAVAGTVTGLLHVKLKIRDLLCGILVSTGLITVNLVLSVLGNGGTFLGDGQSNVTISRQANTILRSFPFDKITMNLNNTGINLRKLIAFFVVAVIVKLLIDLYLKTKNGMLLRATGDNSKFSAMLGEDPGGMKITGLAIGNALASISGALAAQSQGNANQSMGIGMVVIGLASAIIGLSVFSKVRFMKDTTKVIIGACIYQACLTLAYVLGVPTAYNKLIMAFLFTVALVVSNKMKKGGRRA